MIRSFNRIDDFSTKRQRDAITTTIAPGGFFSRRASAWHNMVMTILMGALCNSNGHINDGNA